MTEIATLAQPQFNELEGDVAEKAGQLMQEFNDAEADILKYSCKRYEPLYKKRDEFVEKIDNFWSIALINCFTPYLYIDQEDKKVLQHLTDIKIHRNVEDPRAVSIELLFNPNDYFTNSSLKKDFELAEDADPLPDFEITRDTVTKKTPIDWKSDEVNQCKLRPTQGGVVDQDNFSPGSFFSTFFDNEDVEVAGDIADQLVNDLYPRALEFYTGEACYDNDDEFDDEDFEEDSEGDVEENGADEEEEPVSKKSKNE